MRKPIRAVLIANRGEIALRIIRSCRERGIRTVAVFSEADRMSPHVLQADEAHCIGPAPSRASYLSIPAILEAARRSKADAIHPGYGFLAENAEFAAAVTKAGFLFVGPGASSIRAMGDKVEARRLVRKAGVATVPGTDGPVSSLTEAEEFSDAEGYPILIKAAAGGGGKGMRVVHERAQLEAALKQAQSEALSAFGDPRVYVEKYLEEPRHIEFQILADSHGSTIHLGERECTIQRRHQKIIEESPSVFLDDALRHRMGETAVMAARACGYTNAGTIEFLVDKHRQFYFLEMNTRLQVEHPVTELCTGLDLVAEQLRIAEGNELSLTQKTVKLSGHAIECRICAEDPLHDFLPATGTITSLRAPSGPGIREDRGVEAGGEISVYYDSMIAKVIAWGEHRTQAIQRMRRALFEYEIAGIPTNIPVCLFVLGHPSFAEGKFDTGFLGQNYRPEEVLSLREEDARAITLACAFAEHHHLGAGLNNSVGAPAQGGPHPSAGWKHRRRDFMRER